MRAKKSLEPLRKYRAKVILAPFLKLFEVGTELAMPFLTRYIIDVGIANSDLSYTLMLGGVMLGLAILGFLFTMVAQYLAARVSADFGYDLRKDLYAQLGSLSEKQLNGFGKQKTLTLVNNDAFSLQSGVNMAMRLVLRPPFLLLGSIILSFFIDVRAGFIFTGVVVFSAAVILFVMLVAPKRYAAIQANLDKISSLANDSLKGARPIRAFTKESYEENKFKAAVDSYQEKNMEMARFNSLLNPLTFCAIDLGMALIVYLAKDSLPSGELSKGEVVSLIQYLVSSLAGLVMFGRLSVSINKAAASKKRLDAFLSLTPSIVNAPEALPASANAPLVFFKDVSLSYGKEGEKPAVSHLSFQIREGSWVGMIGGTGSGKSTTLALLERLYDPTAGTILYEGKPLNKVDLSQLHKDLSIVSQKPSLFKGTIRSNLLCGKMDASEEEMIAALKDSLAYEYVAAYPDFLDHEVEEAGANLSGGQKQRLLIARALLHGGKLLILDDATSALDYLSDQKVRSNISAKVGLTKILVSQRAGSLKDCDLILVYDNGQIVASGKHEDLLKTCRIYRDIYEMQRAQA